MNKNGNLRWVITGKTKHENYTIDDIVDVLLANRGIEKTSEKNEFFKPLDPRKINFLKLVDPDQLKKALNRIGKAIKNKEKIIIYGDYDADGICSSAILWECLYPLYKNVIPYIPNRFSEGYGINSDTITKLKKESPELSLIITVDNGIVARDAVADIGRLGIDVIITDHHQKEKRIPDAHSVIHTDKISGAAVAWFFSRELKKHFGKNENSDTGLELAALGTIADQIPLVGINRSIAMYGLGELNKTKRIGLLALYKQAGIERGSLGPYEVGFLLAPRINAMGRLEAGINSLRLLCTKDIVKAESLAKLLGKTNSERQRIVDEVVAHAREQAVGRKWKGVIVLSHESYHEGVIGLAAAKLVEEFRRPAIVICEGLEISKASARSVTGFNIIETIRKTEGLIVGGGGHPMAAGFSIQTSNITKFIKKLDDISAPLLTQDILTKVLKIDLEIDFNDITAGLLKKIKEFEPTGLGNPTPTFLTNNVSLAEVRNVGRDMSHLKLTLVKDNIKLPAIGFGLGKLMPGLAIGGTINIVYSIAEDTWNGNDKIQLKIKDLKTN